ncbi:MAG: hypothetical protein JO340_00605 [Acidobacteriaceae bacterium]|nr:hypothetical protein [Acidobacteriaceae bacterium]
MIVFRCSAVLLAVAANGVLLAQGPETPPFHREELSVALRDGVLHVAADCSETRPCKVRFGNTVQLIKNGGSVKASGSHSGLVLIYVEPSGRLVAGSTLELVCEGCRYERGVSQFPANAIPLFNWAVIDGKFSASGGADYRAEMATKNVASGEGLMATENEGTTTLGIDPALVSMHVLTPPKTSASACSVGEFSFDSDYYYVCVAANKWKRTALSNF